VISSRTLHAGLLVLLSVPLFVAPALVAGCGGDSGRDSPPDIDAPLIDPASLIDCGELPADPITVGPASLSLSDVTCGAALQAGGGTARIADPEGGTFIRLSAAATSREPRWTVPELLIRCEGTTGLLQPTPFASRRAYPAGIELSEAHTAKGWLVFAIRSSCKAPELVARSGETIVHLMHAVK
jgi:hypothetical protein